MASGIPPPPPAAEAYQAAHAAAQAAARKGELIRPQYPNSPWLAQQTAYLEKTMQEQAAAIRATSAAAQQEPHIPANRVLHLLADSGLGDRPPMADPASERAAAQAT